MIRRVTSMLACMTLLMTMSGGAALAQNVVWERLQGFDGGALVRIAVHPSSGTILTTHHDGVFRSTDGGHVWSCARMYL